MRGSLDPIRDQRRQGLSISQGLEGPITTLRGPRISITGTIKTGYIVGAVITVWLLIPDSSSGSDAFSLYKAPDGVRELDWLVTLALMVLLAYFVLTAIVTGLVLVFLEVSRWANAVRFGQGRVTCLGLVRRDTVAWDRVAAVDLVLLGKKGASRVAVSIVPKPGDGIRRTVNLWQANLAFVRGVFEPVCERYGIHLSAPTVASRPDGPATQSAEPWSDTSNSVAPRPRGRAALAIGGLALAVSPFLVWVRVPHGAEVFVPPTSDANLFVAPSFFTLSAFHAVPYVLLIVGLSALVVSAFVTNADEARGLGVVITLLALTSALFGVVFYMVTDEALRDVGWSGASMGPGAAVAMAGAVAVTVGAVLVKKSVPRPVAQETVGSDVLRSSKVISGLGQGTLSLHADRVVFDGSGASELLRDRGPGISIPLASIASVEGSNSRLGGGKLSIGSIDGTRYTFKGLKGEDWVPDLRRALVAAGADVSLGERGSLSVRQDPIEQSQIGAPPTPSLGQGVADAAAETYVYRALTKLSTVVWVLGMLAYIGIWITSPSSPPAWHFWPALLMFGLIFVPTGLFAAVRRKGKIARASADRLLFQGFVLALGVKSSLRPWAGRSFAWGEIDHFETKDNKGSLDVHRSAMMVLRNGRALVLTSVASDFSPVNLFREDAWKGKPTKVDELVAWLNEMEGRYGRHGVASSLPRG